MIKWILIVLAIILVALLTTGFLLSPGKADPFRDENGDKIKGSISEIEAVKLGGYKQFLVIRGKDRKKPILLYLHGGPGDPETIFIKEYYPELEEEFVVVNWEQKGAGKSYYHGIDKSTMTLEQFISDGHELTLYLKEKFNREKIYLMGHSWGTILGMYLIKNYPEDYKAYMGIGQIADILQGELISQEFVVEQAKADGKEKVAEEIAAYDLESLTTEEFQNYIKKQRKYVRKYGGAVRQMSFSEMLKPLLLAKEYTLVNKINYLRGEIFSMKYLWGDILENNLKDHIKEVEVPVFVFQGKYDYQTPIVLAKQYLEELKAPEKAFFVFENSAHSPLFEEQEKFHSLLMEHVLKK